MNRKNGVKRCAVEGCRKTIEAKFNFCYEHKFRRHQLKDNQMPGLTSGLRKFYCDNCGQTAHLKYKDRCQICGHELEEVS